MPVRRPLIFLVVINLLTLPTLAQPTIPPQPTLTQPTLPGPKYGTDTYTPADFQELLSKLKAEREGLDADWNALARRMAKRTTDDGPDLDRLHKQLKQTLDRLQQERLKSMPTFPVAQIPKIETPTPNVKPETEPKAPDPQPTVHRPDGATDILHLGQTLLRAGRYDDALIAFKQLDLKGKKAEERVPIIYMMANCLYQVGKADDAFRLLREAANSRGDERFANYSQWQLDSLRWQRGVEGKLDEIRQRRLAAEKK